MKHSFFVGQELYWQAVEPVTEIYLKCVVTEIHKKEDYAIARTTGNRHPMYDDLLLWIDQDTEKFFFDAV